MAMSRSGWKLKGREYWEDSRCVCGRKLLPRFELLLTRKVFLVSENHYLIFVLNVRWEQTVISH